MRVPVVPFLTPSPTMISHTEWAWFTGDGEFPLPPELPHWDYQTTLHLRAGLRFDRSDLLASCHLGPETRLGVYVTATSSHTRHETVAHRGAVPRTGVVDLSLIAELHGAEFGGQLTLSTHLVVLNAHPLDRLAASAPGSVLFRHRQRTQLEGTGAQFPTDATDFTKSHPHTPHAAWELRIDTTDPEAPFMSAVRLTLNSANPQVTRLMSGTRDDATEQLLRTLNWDVTRQLVQAALRLDEVEGLSVDGETVSLAGVLRNLLGAIWPVESVATLRRWAEQDPSRIETRVQSHARMLK